MGAVLSHFVAGLSRHGVCPQSCADIRARKYFVCEVNRAVNYRDGDLSRPTTCHLVQLAQTF